MKFLGLSLVFVLVIMIGVTQQAYSESFVGDYLLQGNGFTASEDSVSETTIDLQFSINKPTNNIFKLALEDGVISFFDDDYIALDDWTGSVLREGKFLRLSGNAENADGDKIAISLLARLVENSKAGSVYTLTGKITTDNESVKVIYSAKVVGATLSDQSVTPTKETTKNKTIQIEILSGASDPKNIKYYSKPTIEITPGTTIVWKNNDSVTHRIMSGVASFSHGKPFQPDGKINSGDIAPGQTFKTTIEEQGITRFFDTTYPWMDGVIISASETATKSLKIEKPIDNKLKTFN